MWKPKFPSSNKPIYLGLADAIAEAISGKELRPGDRLPPQRELAKSMGVTVGTVNQAYIEARRRGLVSSRVGSGTFVRERATASNSGRVTSEMRVALSESLQRMSRLPDLADRLIASRAAGEGMLTEAGYRWLSDIGLESGGQDVHTFTGAQHALSSLFTAVLNRGDTLVCEELTFPGVRALASMYSLNLVPAPIDSEGVVPEALAEICKRERPKLLHLVPALHMPTNALMSTKRRITIAEVARDFDLLIAEDDPNSALIGKPSPPIATLAPERTIYVSDVAHALCPALRCVFVSAPTSLTPVLERAKRATLVAVPALEPFIFADWIAEGASETLLEARREDLAQRNRIAQECFAGQEVSLHPASSNIWLRMSSGWRAADLEASAKAAGLEAGSGEHFAVAPEKGRDGLMISLFPKSDITDLAQALRSIADLAKQPPPIDVPSYR